MEGGGYCGGGGDGGDGGGKIGGGGGAGEGVKLVDSRTSVTDTALVCRED